MKVLKKNDLSFFDHYTIDRKTPHSDETILKDKITNSYVLMKEITIESTNDFKRMVQTLQGQKGLKNDHLLSLIDYRACSEVQFQEFTSHKLITFHQYSSHNLLQQINARIQQGKHFEEYEIWSILCSTVLGLSYLQKQNIGHGCVSPLDIYLSSDGVVKIADPSITTSSPFILAKGYYYSPEAMNYFKRQNIIQNINIFKSDIFSLGICILHACLLDNCQQCYDYEQFTIQSEVLKQKFNSLVGIYSRQLLNMIYQILSFDIETRPSFIDLELRLLQVMNSQNEGNQSTINYLSFSKNTESFSQMININQQKEAQTINNDQEDSNNILKNPPKEIDEENTDINEEQYGQNHIIMSLQTQINENSQQTTQIERNISLQKDQILFINKNKIKNYQLAQQNYQKRNQSDKGWQNVEGRQKYIQKQNKIQLRSKENQKDVINGVQVQSKAKKQDQSDINKNQTKYQIYTDPNLLRMIRDDVERITIKRSRLDQISNLNIVQ